VSFYRTRKTLLEGIKDSRNAEAWGEFVDLHTPLVYSFCRKRGLSEEDASDLAQEVMRAIALAIGNFEYDPARGRFRSWFFTVVRSKFYTFLEKEKRRPLAVGNTAVLRLSDAQPSSGEDRDWELDYRRQVFRWAVSRVRPQFSGASWDSFWRTAVQSEDPAAVASDLRTSRGAVYAAKARVIGALQECVQRVGGDWDLDVR
jgi:RNA polymerase sigma-70 factor (ECF subfamily)